MPFYVDTKVPTANDDDDDEANAKIMIKRLKQTIFTIDTINLVTKSIQLQLKFYFIIIITLRIVCE